MEDTNNANTSYTPTTGCKYDTGKLRWDLLPLDLIEEVVRVYTAGATKYGENNWKELENGYDRYKAAMFRHLLQYEKGVIFDYDTGCRHLAQVAWNAIAMLYFSLKEEKGPTIPEQMANLLWEPYGSKTSVSDCDKLIERYKEAAE